MHLLHLRLLPVFTAAALAALLAACGGGADEPGRAEARAQPLAVVPTVIAPLFDDLGQQMPAADSAAPADPGARTRHGRYATPAQAAQLQDALGVLVIAVEVAPGPDAAAAVDLAQQMVWGHQAAHDLPADAPVLVRSTDPRLAAATVHQLEAAGYSRVFLVTQ